MARLSVTYGAPRRDLVFAAGTGEIRRPLGADVSMTAGLAADLANAQEIGAALEAVAGLAVDIAGGTNLRAAIDAAASLSADAQQDHQLANALSGAADLAGDVESQAATGDPFRATVVTYTGNGSTQSVTGVGFQPEMVIMCENGLASDADRIIQDTAHGFDEGWQPQGTSNFGDFTLPWSVISEPQAITSFDADGFSLDANDRVNASGQDYMALCLRRGENGETANFDVIEKPNTTDTIQTVTHSAGAVPVWVFVKQPDTAAGEWVDPWTLGAEAADTLGGAKKSDSLALDAVSATEVDLNNGSFWNDTSETDETAGLYIFGGDEQAGSYKTGTYTGSGADGNAITGLGFAPSVVLIRAIDGKGVFLLSGQQSPQTIFGIHAGDRHGSFSLDADGFTVDTGEANTSAESYRYFAWA